MIVFFISCFGHGKGGHFHSLKVISEELSLKKECIIISVGPRLSPTISKIDKLPVYHFNYNGIGFHSTLRRIHETINKYHRDSIILHAFDEHAFLFARVLAVNNGYGLALTKCGGPNPRYFYPYAKNMIVFSEENYVDFKRKGKFRNSNIAIIPNRVKKVELDQKRIELLRKKLHITTEDKVILKIGRINEHYRKTIEQAVYLQRQIEKTDINVHLIILGVIQNTKTYNDIVAELPPRVHMITEDEFTIRSNELINVADIIIGTGRGLMEACSLGKVVLTPNLSSKLPVLVTRENIESLLYTNFSPRNKVLGNDLITIEKLREILTNNIVLDEYRRASFYYFKKFFDINSGIENYEAFYDTLSSSTDSHIDVAINKARFFLKVVIIKLKVIR